LKKEQEVILEREEILNLEIEKIRLEDKVKDLDKTTKSSEEKRAKLFAQIG